MKRSILAVSLLAAIMVTYVWKIHDFNEQEAKILKPTPSLEPKPKRYVLYNAKEFERKDKEISSMSVNILSNMGAMNVKQLEVINGASFEIEDEEKIKAFNLTIPEGWEIQEEYEHGILQWRCTRCENIPCPGNPGPTPTPNPSPTPVPSPGPNPPSPVEPDKSWGRARVRAAQGQALVDTSQVKVCVIDTGIDLQHPNKGNVIASTGFAGAVQDRQGHGTHTAGTVAGSGGIGVSRASLLICKGLSDSGSGSSSALAQCLTWCGQQNAHIVSNSWGSPQQDRMINQAIAGLTQRGIAVVVANGNDSRGQLNWPAALSQTNPLVFGIAASDQRDQKANFSTYGPGTKYIAPGVQIVSNWPGGSTRALDGTSMATPHVAGLMAFCVAKGIGFENCLKTDDLRLPETQQGAGLPRADLTVQQ